MARPNKPNGRKREGLDETDLQILAVKASNPDATVREIAAQVGKSPSAVCVRLQRIPEQHWVKDIRAKLEALLPLAVDNYRDRLDGADDSADTAADKLLAGMGYFRSKHDHDVHGSLVLSEDSVVEFLRGCGTPTFERICERVNAEQPPTPHA